MRLSDFILLKSEKKKSVVLIEGVLVAKRNYSNCLVFLFQMDNYYVETFCNLESRDIEEYRVFSSTAPLHPYLQQIGLNDLLN